VLDSTLPKHKIMRTANKQEITALKQAIRTVERQLRWRTGAYCEGETRQIFKKKTPVTLTSNTEAIRRAKNNSTRQGKSKEALSCK